jgi:hypothetical protein
MHEAMRLFESLVNEERFKHEPIILLLNKIDLFHEKLLKSPISTYFPDYKGKDSDTEAAAAYFTDRFQALIRTADREVHTYYINATDTTLLKGTMQSIQDLVTASKRHRASLTRAGFLPTMDRIRRTVDQISNAPG